MQEIRSGINGTRVNLGEESEFYQYDLERQGRLRITNYSPDRLKSHHYGKIQEYYISDYVLNADVIINVPKPKTHRKAGFTAAMKNLVGINVRKEYLPHHTMGSVSDGGDEYKNRSWLRRLEDNLYDKKNTCEGNRKFSMAAFYWYIAGALKVLSQRIYHDEGEGSWYGNHTISKTIVDLNKILNYADKNGKLCEVKQRKILHIGDMIISGEREGPVAPSPKRVGAIVVSGNAFSFDYAVGTMMGARMDGIPFIIDAENANQKYPLLPSEQIKILSNETDIADKKPGEISEDKKWKFVPSKGWKPLFIENSSI